MLQSSSSQKPLSSHLNAQIFERADTLSLTGLVEVMPRDIGSDVAFKELSFAIRELKATVMDRIAKGYSDAEIEAIAAW